MTPIVFAHRLFFLLLFAMTTWVAYLGLFDKPALYHLFSVPATESGGNYVAALYGAAAIACGMSAALSHLVYTRSLVRAALAWSAVLILVTLIHTTGLIAPGAEKSPWNLLASSIVIFMAAAGLTLWARAQWKSRSKSGDNHQPLPGDPVDSRIRSKLVFFFFALTALTFAMVGGCHLLMPHLAAGLWTSANRSGLTQYIAAPWLALAVASADLAARRSRLGAFIPLVALMVLGILITIIATAEAGQALAQGTTTAAVIIIFAITLTVGSIVSMILIRKS